MEILTPVIGILAFASWLFALVSWVLAVANRRPEVPLTRLLFRGYAAFDSSNFTEKGQKHQRRFFIGFACFFLLVFVTIGVGIATQG